MTINITTWRPDTCDCVIHYSWDNSVNEDNRVHTPVEQVITHDGQVVKRKVCPAHSSFGVQGKHVEHHDAIKEENQRKNKVLGIIMENMSSLVDNKIDNEGNPFVEFKSGKEPEWSFDSNRNLLINFKTKPGPQERNLINPKISAISDKIIIS